MKGFLSHRPSASMVVAMLALVVATSGTAIAASSLVNGDSLIKKGTLSGSRLRNHTITGTQVNLSKLGKVPKAGHADSATTATTATNAATATVAHSLPTLTWNSLMLANGWVPYTSSAYGPPGLQYAKDAEGFVHLRGTLNGFSQTSKIVATLPAGFRPPSGAWTAVGETNGSFLVFAANLWIDSSGNISVENSTGANDIFVSFEGVEFYVG